jgi:dTDP-4-dehydrorhamnose reductase
MKILLMGASSYLGARLCIDLGVSHEIVGTYAHNQLSDSFLHLDITDKKQVVELIHSTNPDVIVHAANNADARWCEAQPEAARELNESSTQSIIDAANEIGVKVIYISSFAAMAPANVYGKTKKGSEEIVKNAKSGWNILRPSLIIGFSPNTKNDRPFNRFLKNLDEGTRAEYDTSWKFQPTWAGHISEVILKLVEQNIFGSVIPIGSSGLKNRYEVASDILTPFHVPVFPIDKHDSTPVITDDFSVLSKLVLPQYSYKQIIEKIIEEIRNRSHFNLK